MDIVVAGRISNKYPTAPKSYILENDKGIFKDVTSSVCPQLQEAGMITSVIAADFDNDGKTDLIIAGEWMPIRLFKNTGSGFKEITNETGLKNTNGIWRSLAAADIDNDGDIDFIAGNSGLNNKYHVSSEKPMVLYAKDLDGNGSIDPVVGYYIKDGTSKSTLYPSPSFSQVAEQVPSIRKQFFYYSDFAKATMADIFKQQDDDPPFIQLYCDELHSCWFENIGNGRFIKHLLPAEAQFAPLNTIVCSDVNKDGKLDLLLAGNEYQVEVMTGRYDASYGSCLLGDGKGNFFIVKSAASGFALKGDVKDMKLIRLNNKEQLLIAAVNNDKVRVFQLQTERGAAPGHK